MLLSSIADRTAQCAVIGMGVVGRQTFDLLSKAGFPTCGFDRSVDAVERARDVCAFTCHDAIGTDPSVLRGAQIVMVAVRLPVRLGHTDLEPLRAVADVLNDQRCDCRLVVLQSTVPPGATRMFARDWLEQSQRGTNLVGYSPERLQEANNTWNLMNTPRLVAGVNAEALRCTETFVKSVCESVVPVDPPEVAELSKLLENAFIACGISLLGELTTLASAHNASAKAIACAAATKPYGYYPFWPGSGFGGHCIPNDLMILRNAMAEKGLDAPLLSSVGAVAAGMPLFLVAKLRHHLNRPLAGQRVLIVGVGFKPGSSDTVNSPAEPLIRELLRQNAIPAYLDERVPQFSVDGVLIERVTATERLRPCVAIALSSSDDISKAPPQSIELLLDASRGAIQAPPSCRVVPI